MCFSSSTSPPMSIRNKLLKMLNVLPILQPSRDRLHSIEYVHQSFECFVNKALCIKNRAAAELRKENHIFFYLQFFIHLPF